MKNNIIEESLKSVHDFCKKEEYIGYGSYDSHLSPIPFEKLGTKLSFLINQVNKRSPVNLRPILGIKKGINPKGYGLFLHAYSLLADMDVIDKQEAKEKAHFFFNWLIENPSRGYSGYCWGYNFLWPKKDGNDVPPYMPNVVVTAFVVRGLMAYYEKFKDEKVKKILSSTAEFVLNDVHLYNGQDGYCFSYTPLKKSLVVNANLLAAEILAYADYINETKKYKYYIEQAIRFTLNNHNDDGSWYYSFDYYTRRPKKQIDFHQGFVLESLHQLYKYTSLEITKEIHHCIEKGLSFYYKNQFHANGWAYWRLPSKWPVDIHNQSQGIITFSKLNEFNEEFLPFANKIANWTINNMQGKKGNFYYQKWPLITNKVNYLRLNQAWLLLALTTFIKEASQ